MTYFQMKGKAFAGYLSIAINFVKDKRLKIETTTKNNFNI